MPNGVKFERIIIGGEVELCVAFFQAHRYEHFIDRWLTYHAIICDFHTSFMCFHDKANDRQIGNDPAGMQTTNFYTTLK